MPRPLPDWLVGFDPSLAELDSAPRAGKKCPDCAQHKPCPAHRCKAIGSAGTQCKNYGSVDRGYAYCGFHGCDKFLDYATRDHGAVRCMNLGSECEHREEAARDYERYLRDSAGERQRRMDPEYEAMRMQIAIETMAAYERSDQKTP